MSNSRRDQKGFALLLVFAMAAAIAIMLYMQLPRAAFEAQRGREEMLVQRGEQYQRGIELYVRKFKKYPKSMDDLEKSTGVRFLRQRYKDPLTGSDEWRLVHIDDAGRFTDSLTQKQKGPNDKKEYQNTFISEGPSLGAAQSAANTGVNIANRRRASDQPGAPGSGAIQPGTEDVAGAPPAPPDPSNPNPDASQQNPNAPETPGAVAIDPATGQPVQVPQGQPGQSNPQPGQPNPQPPQQGMPPFPPVGLNVGGNQPQPGQPRNPDPSQQQIGRGQNNSLGNLQQNPVLNQIQQSLTSPRPGAQLSASGQPGNALGGPMGQQIGGGIAGVASKLEADSIRIYNEHQKYNEWEFIYDFSKAKGGAGQPGQAGQNAGVNSNNKSNSNSNSGFGSGSGFGGGGGFGSSSGFGSGGGQGGSQSPPPQRP